MWPPKLQAKVDAIHVPCKGGGPLLTDLMGGQIQCSFGTMTAATPHVKNRKVLAIAQKMNEDVNKALAMADVQERLETYGAGDGGGTSRKFAAFIRSEMAKWARVVKDGNIRIES